MFLDGFATLVIQTVWCGMHGQSVVMLVRRLHFLAVLEHCGAIPVWRKQYVVCAACLRVPSIRTRDETIGLVWFAAYAQACCIIHGLALLF